MEDRRSQMAFRWSILTGGLIALFWVIYYFINGSMPSGSDLMWNRDQIITTLPSSLPRYFDIPLGPFASIILVYLLTLKTREGLVAGLSIGLAFGLLAGIDAVLGLGLNADMVIGLIAGVVGGLFAAWHFGLGFGLVFTLIAGLIGGLAVSIILWPSVVLGFGLGLILRVLLKIFCRRSWNRLWNWLMVR